MNKNSYRITSLLAGLLCLVFSYAFPQDKYLLVVDAQNQFYENTKLENQANKMIDSINLIINKTDSQNVIYIKASSKILSLTSKGFTGTIVTPELDSKLKIVNSNIFTKVEGDAFTVEGLNKFLKERHAKEVIITGMLAEKCVYSTALGAKEKGYDVYVVPEAVISKSEKKKENVLKKMAKKGIRILPIREIISTK